MGEEPAYWADTSYISAWRICITDCNVDDCSVVYLRVGVRLSERECATVHMCQLPAVRRLLYHPRDVCAGVLHHNGAVHGHLLSHILQPSSAQKLQSSQPGDSMIHLLRVCVCVCVCVPVSHHRQC